MKFRFRFFSREEGEKLLTEQQAKFTPLILQYKDMFQDSDSTNNPTSTLRPTIRPALAGFTQNSNKRKLTTEAGDNSESASDGEVPRKSIRLEYEENEGNLDQSREPQHSIVHGHRVIYMDPAQANADMELSQVAVVADCSQKQTMTGVEDVSNEVKFLKNVFDSKTNKLNLVFFGLCRKNSKSFSKNYTTQKSVIAIRVSAKLSKAILCRHGKVHQKRTTIFIL